MLYYISNRNTRTLTLAYSMTINGTYLSDTVSYTIETGVEAALLDATAPFSVLTLHPFAFFVLATVVVGASLQQSGTLSSPPNSGCDRPSDKGRCRCSKVMRASLRSSKSRCRKTIHLRRLPRSNHSRTAAVYPCTRQTNVSTCV